jgi:CheY-like chemotaxis protein
MAAKIVIVHDNPDFRDSAEAVLLAAGHEVWSYSTALAALVAINGLPPINLLITCVRFPPGESNGVALARSARLKHRDIKILFVTAPEFQMEAEELGTFLAAPASISDLLQAVQKVLA